MESRRDQTRNVGDVRKQVRANLVGNRTERRKINNSRVGTCTCDNHFWLVLERQGANVIHVNQVSILADFVANDVVIQA